MILGDQETSSFRTLSVETMIHSDLDRFPGKPLCQVQLIIHSPGLAYALNDFLEVISHLRRDYNVTRIGERMTNTNCGRLLDAQSKQLTESHRPQ